MPYIYGLLALVGIFLLLGQFTKLQAKQKALAAFITALVVVGLYLFEEQNNQARAKTQALLLAFEHGKVLECNEIKVEKKDFNYAYGTRSFIAQEESSHKGLIIPIKDCKIP